ncbi:SDR family NAD(P)-dependent oxidoreductase [Leifsonia sp. PS1209]|uniref:SDR family NAD(P)-dependent oxidoreductase n=1 Tax=Leifsonia sp. PS1209 TaxID=2724914 RepID=UPI001442C2AC|nr:SDR family NAD(P)-dependent oxidoreductase [Leifsonia sp. PS1209]QIZ98789.1 SDR family oxidoreductase [Leifsonia sp. PS1209]
MNAVARPGALLDGRVAWVTGSSRGIGAAIAAALAQEGAAVAVHGRDAEAAAAVRDRIVAAGGRAAVVLGDVTEPDDIERMVGEVESQLGPIDVLVANAGGNPVRPGLLEDMTVEQWRSAVDANLTATFATIAGVLPGMKQRGSGAIITMSSAAARRPTPQSPVAYAAAKAGIELLTKWLAAEAGPSGIRVNCVAPETILTERNQDMIPAEIQTQLIATHPVRRLGTPQDVADACVFLASDRSAWTSGVVLDVAGGSVLR